MVPSHICIIQATKLSASPRSLRIMGNFRKTKKLLAEENIFLSKNYAPENTNNLGRFTSTRVDMNWKGWWHSQRYFGLREKRLTWRTAKKGLRFKGKKHNNIGNSWPIHISDKYQFIFIRNIPGFYIFDWCLLYSLLIFIGIQSIEKSLHYCQKPKANRP